MKTLITIGIILMSFGANGQSKNPPDKVLWGVNFSPDLNFRTLSGSVVIDNLVTIRNNSEVPKFGYTTGLNVSIPLARRLSLETGIQYSYKGYKSKKQELIFEMPDPNAPKFAEGTHSFHYIGIPLKAKFLFGMNKIQFHSSVGIVTNFLLAANVATTLEYTNAPPQENKFVMTDDYHRIDLSLNLAAGMDYPISKNMLLFVEPTFRYGMLNASKSYISEHFWSLGLNLGAYYKFN